MIDLDAQREQRAAAREGRAEPEPIKIGGKVIGHLTPELPIDVFAPLRNLDGDLTLLLREAVDQAKREQAAAATGQTVNRWDIGATVIDVLATNPALPVTALDTIREVAANLLGEEGLSNLLEARPSGQDYAALATGIFAYYGMSLGEALPSSDSSTSSGGTSSTTSSDTSGSTPEESGDRTESPDPASLAPAGS